MIEADGYILGVPCHVDDLGQESTNEAATETNGNRSRTSNAVNTDVTCYPSGPIIMNSPLIQR